MLFPLNALRIRSALRFPKHSVPHEVSCQTFPAQYRWRPHGTVDIREHGHVRVSGHQEPLDHMQKHGILIDGEVVVDGGETKILLQIFSNTVIGPIFFEFIQRKGDDGFGEGNFKALFESIEREQLENGEIAAE